MSENRIIDDYVGVIGQGHIDEIKDLAGRLEGATITHINSTRTGGGVAEILQNLVPLANSLRLKANWLVMKDVPTEFFKVTKSFHNALQGMELPLTGSMRKIYLDYNKEYSKNIDVDSDVVFIHDPQPAPLIELMKRKGKFLWRCHIDLTKANTVYWNFIKRFVVKYDALIFSLNKYVLRDIRDKKTFIVAPSIDPLSDKNRALSPDEVIKTIDKYDIDPERPIIMQVARFDYWKDPLGVIECYKLVRKKISKTQLLLVGNMPQDDPEGEEWYEKTIKGAESIKDIHVLTDRDGVGDLEVNAFQRASNVVIQKSIREGFGLSVAEALWKGTPVVATRAGGIPLQVIEGVTGYLVSGVEETSNRIIHLLRNHYLAKMLGMEGKEHIKRNFLITRHLRDYIEIHLELI